MEGTSEVRPGRTPDDQPGIRVAAPPGGVAVVAVSGDVDLAGAGRVGTAVGQALARRPAALVVDMSAVTFLDSSGLDQLVEARRAAAVAVVPMHVVVAGNRAVARPLEVTGLAAVFTLADSVQSVAETLDATAAADQDHPHDR
ncbi:MAG: STAS domain-containing protein [Pseudonocardia sp.]|uniref:STAS domain-containing protein n=3 Tax=unclassified Pseudonocardia TaxID=2619320 RepID=UPI001ACD0562|nr:STAS domain-containing protein [Pseudonocardia sp.]MBN9107687.1 STAS domain-containing protein [Pseudonocardia sp.]